MTRSVAIYCHRKTGVILLRPMGRFAGCGASISIWPMREVPADDPGELGELIVDLLARSVYTGFSINDHEQYDAEHGDATSKEIVRRHRLDKLSTKQSIDRFAWLTVELPRGRRSWRVLRYHYQRQTRCAAVGNDITIVAPSRGTRGLGNTVIRLATDESE